MLRFYYAHYYNLVHHDICRKLSMTSGSQYAVHLHFPVEHGRVDVQPLFIICSTSTGASSTFCGNITGTSLPSIFSLSILCRIYCHSTTADGLGYSMINCDMKMVSSPSPSLGACNSATQHEQRRGTIPPI